MLAEIFGMDGIIVVVIVAAVLLFGGTALPKLARGLGSARHEFESGLKESAPVENPTAGDGGASVGAPAAVAPAALPVTTTTAPVVSGVVAPAAEAAPVPAG